MVLLKWNQVGLKLTNSSAGYGCILTTNLTIVFSIGHGLDVSAVTYKFEPPPSPHASTRVW